jgi:hypothetical protein
LRDGPEIAIVAKGYKDLLIVKKKSSTVARKKKKENQKPKKGARASQDRRRKHKHWQVTIYYRDGERFARVYIDRERALRFAERQKKSPVVKSTRILEVD